MLFFSFILLLLSYEHTTTHEAPLSTSASRPASSQQHLWINNLWSAPAQFLLKCWWCLTFSSHSIIQIPHSTSVTVNKSMGITGPPQGPVSKMSPASTCWKNCTMHDTKKRCDWRCKNND